jgi:biopolymer transport protein ExbD
MGMSVTTGGGPADDEKPMSEINTTPLVDVMLVLLILFLITIPVITQSVKVDLPKAANIPTQTKPENINIAVDRDGNIFWNTAMVPNQEALLERIKQIAVMDPQPEVHVRGDRATPYEYVGRVIVICQRGGIQKVGFITEPDRGLGR